MRAHTPADCWPIGSDGVRRAHLVGFRNRSSAGGESQFDAGRRWCCMAHIESERRGDLNECKSSASCGHLGNGPATDHLLSGFHMDSSEFKQVSSRGRVATDAAGPAHRPADTPSLMSSDSAGRR